jgi:hypothetical protein
VLERRPQLTASIAEAAVNFMKSGGLTGSRGSAQIDGKSRNPEPDERPAAALLAGARKDGIRAPRPTAQAPDAAIHHRNHALFAFKALACSQIVSGPNQTTLRLFHFQSAAQLTRINLPATMTQGFSHQFVIAHNGVAFEEMLFCILK